MKEYLVFRLYGAMASWGQAAVGGDRPTAIQPSRSAIIGLLAAALGIKRDEEDELQQLQRSIHIAIKQSAPSVLIRDYHTTQVPSHSKKRRYATRKQELSEAGLNTILSSRDYRCDGLWTVVITLTKEPFRSLVQLSESLQKPVFTLYLGRKSCPLSLPLNPKVIASDHLKEALDTAFPPLTLSAKEDAMRLSQTSHVTYFWEGGKDALDNLSTVMVTQPWDEPIHRGRWQFSQRQQYQCSIRENV